MDFITVIDLSKAESKMSKYDPEIDLQNSRKKVKLTNIAWLACLVETSLLKPCLTPASLSASSIK